MQWALSKLLSSAHCHLRGCQGNQTHLKLLLLLLAHLLPLIDDSSPQNPGVLFQMGEVGGGGGAGHQGGAAVSPGAIHGAQRLAVRLQKPMIKRYENNVNNLKSHKTWMHLRCENLYF